MRSATPPSSSPWPKRLNPSWTGPQQKLWVERLEREHDNLRAALSWVLEREDGELGLRFGGALWRFWYSWGYVSEGIGWMGRVLAERRPFVERLDGARGHGVADSEARRRTSERGPPTKRCWSYPESWTTGGNLATALNTLGTLAASTEATTRGEAVPEENLAVLERAGGRRVSNASKRFHASNLLGLLALNEDEITRGRRSCGERAWLWRGRRETRMRIGVSLVYLGYAAAAARRQRAGDGALRREPWRSPMNTRMRASASSPIR